MDLFSTRANLLVDEHGIWRTNQKYAMSYPEDGNESCFDLEDASFWFRHRNDCILAAVHRFPPLGNGPIVDVGGGNGFVAKRFQDEGFQTILLEPGTAGAFNARTKRQLPHVICATLEDAGFHENSLPAVGLFDVLEHIEHDAEFLRHVHTGLTPGGFLYATVPAHQWLWSLSDVSAGHYRRYNAKTLQELLSPDFEILQLTYYFQPLVVPLLLLRSLPFRVGLARQRNVMDSATEHGISGGLMARMLARLLRREVARICRGNRILTGTSCLVVGRAV